MTLNIAKIFNYADCHHAECRYAEYRYAECRYAECLGAIHNTSFYT
jgi:hypothetical protein